MCMYVCTCMYVCMTVCMYVQWEYYGLSVLHSTQITCRSGSCISQCNTVALWPFCQHSPHATNVCYMFIVIITTYIVHVVLITAGILQQHVCCVGPASASVLEQHSILLPFHSSSSSSGSPTGCPRIALA